MKTLIIQSQPAQKLSSQQQAFNRNIKKVESLQRDIDRYTELLDGKLTDYAKELVPLLEKKKEASKKMLTLLFGFLSRPKFLRPHEKSTLKGLMRRLMTDYLNHNSQGPDADMKKIFHVVFGSSFEDAQKEAFEDVKMDMRSAFDQMGVDIDDIDMEGFHHNMTEDEMIKRLNELRAKMHDEEEKKEPSYRSADKPKKETKQQLKQRLAKEVQEKSISSIYKTLVKALHPDLERDENKKKEKEEIMKKVTSAYQNKDLHTLLKLELEILLNEENDAAKLSNEKIKAYNELLREQIEDLKYQLDMVPNHPKYSPLSALCQYPDNLFSVNIKRKAMEFKGIIDSIQLCVSALQGNGQEAERELRGILNEEKQFNKMQRQRDKEFEFPF
jgi:hypothetical protein